MPTERHPSHNTGCPRSLIILGPAARPRVPDRWHSWLPDNKCDRHSVLVTASRDLCLPLSISGWPLATLGEAAMTEKCFIWGQRPTSQALSSHNSATHEPDRSIQWSPHPKTPGGPHCGGLESQNFSRKVQQTWSHQARPQERSGALTTKPQPSDSRLQITFVTGFIQEPEGLSTNAFMVFGRWRLAVSREASVGGWGAMSCPSSPEPSLRPALPSLCPLQGPGPGLTITAASSPSLCTGLTSMAPHQAHRAHCLRVTG